MKQSSLDRLALELSKLLTRIHDYCKIHCEKGQPFGAYTVPFPTRDIQAELEKRAAEYFQKMIKRAFRLFKKYPRRSDASILVVSYLL